MSVSNCLKGLFYLSLLFLIVLVPSCSKEKEEDEDPDVTADEGIYMNEIYASGDDWIELYNKSATSKDISGYKIYDDVANKYTLPAGTTVPGNGFLIIHCDDTNTGLHTNFKLTSAGETVYLENKSGSVIDKVIYPAMDNGQSYGRYPDGSATFAMAGSTSKGASNGDSNAPAIASVTRSPLVVGPNDQVTVSANFLTVNGIASVKLYYRANSAGNFTEVNMTASGLSYVATIPALAAEGRIDYYVEAKNNSGNAAKNPYQAPDKTHYYLMTTDVLPALVINEFMAYNSSCCPDNASGTEEFDDWIEIYNNSDSPIDIGGMYLSDDATNPFNHRIPDDNPGVTTIPARGYLVIWADNDQDQGELHLDFSLSNTGEELGLYYYDGRTISEFAFGAQTENVSQARNPNGTGSFSADATPTPGAANQ
jgi:hypothetical protein